MPMPMPMPPRMKRLPRWDWEDSPPLTSYAQGTSQTESSCPLIMGRLEEELPTPSPFFITLRRHASCHPPAERACCHLLG